MTQTVTMPDGTTHNFPDEATPQMISQALGIGSQKPSQGNNAGALNAMVYGVGGGSIPFGNRMTSALGALFAKPFTDQGLGELYNQAQEDTKATQEANPLSTLGGNVIGIASTFPMALKGAITGEIPTQGARGVINEIPDAIAKVRGFVGSGKAAKDAGKLEKLGSTLLRSGKSAIVAAPVGAAYGAGDAEPGKMLEGARTGAELAASLGAAGPIVSDLAGAANNALGKTVIPTSEKVRSAGGKLFQKAESEGGFIDIPSADKFRDKVLSTLDLDSEAKLYASNPVAERLVNNISEFKGKPITFNTAKQIDEKLGDLAYSTMDKFGKLDSEGKKFLDLQHELRSHMDEIAGGDTIKQARDLWSTSLRMRDIERIVDKAQGAEQPTTMIKNGFRRLRDTGMKGYTEAEKKAIKQAAHTGIVTDVFKLAGSGLVPIGSAIAGSAGGIPGSIAAGATGYGIQQASKKIGVARQTARANKALQAVAERTGMVTHEPLVQIPEGLSSLLPAPQESKLLQFSKKFNR